MRIVHITPHLPPDQAANALLPFQLGEWARARGDTVRFIAHPPVAGPAPPRSDTIWIPRTRRSPLQRVLRTGSMSAAWRIKRIAEPIINSADVVHIHSNGLLVEVGAHVASQLEKPVVLTMYGTEIWHYRPKRFGPDLFTRAYRAADAVTFYSQRLFDRARELGLDRPGCRVIYPAVGPAFAYHDRGAQLRERRGLGVAAEHLLVNVKRLHPLAGQRYLIDAMRQVIAAEPDTHLVVCGTGALLGTLQDVARTAGVDKHVTFAGLVENALVARYCAAADCFVLPSLLEALPTVAVEALAAGTPVISSDNPGGVELHGLFGDDVQVVPRENAAALAGAIAAALRRSRRTLPDTKAILEQRFRPEAVARQYWDVYAGVLRR
jgi:glycosyltransferase involved in cell wall biosynthesis